MVWTLRSLRGAFFFVRCALMAKVIPVLDEKGFVTDLVIKADQALSNFYISQRSQSDSFRGQIVSLSDLIRRFGSDPKQLRDAAQELLSNYFSRQFDAADVQVTTAVTGPSIDLQIDVILRDGAQEITLSHAVKATNSIIKSIIDLQNTGKEIIPADLLSVTSGVSG